MRINSLLLEDYRGYSKARFDFGDFTCLIGPNGIGKTSVLEAISLICSSLDFSGVFEAPEAEEEDWVPSITPEERLRVYLRKNIRNIDEPDAADGFRISAEIDHEGQKLEVVLNHQGFEKNDLIEQDWWWAGVCYMARFDQDMGNFVLPMELWPQFAAGFEGIYGFPVEPDEYTFNPHADEDMLPSLREEMGKKYATGFWMKKERGRVHSRKCSAGERKVAKALSQIVALPEERLPHIVLVDNIEMHVHYKRHLATVAAIQDMFKGKQVISTTHSTVIMSDYEPKDHLVDVEDIHMIGA